MTDAGKQRDTTGSLNQAQSATQEPVSDVPEIRSPSPKRASIDTSSLLGLGDGSQEAPPPPSTTITYPHLSNYIATLIATSPRKPAHGAAHPLSVSSSGKSSGSDEDLTDTKAKEAKDVTPEKSGSTQTDKEALVRKIVKLLDDDEEEEIKQVLRPYLGDIGNVSVSYGGIPIPTTGRRCPGTDLPRMHA